MLKVMFPIAGIRIGLVKKGIELIVAKDKKCLEDAFASSSVIPRSVSLFAVPLGAEEEMEDADTLGARRES